ncbi:MAG: RNA methyltransferase [Oscillospiraceae bacterium]
MKIIPITSRKNPIVKETAALLLSGEKRKMQGIFLVEGARLSLDAAESGTSIFRLFYTKHACQKYKNYLDPLLQKAEECYLIEEHVAELLSSTKSNQGVFCVCQMREQMVLPEIKGKIIVLENLQDPSNLGAVLRTGEAMGIENFLLLGDCCDPYASKALRASMGAIFRAKLYFEKSAAAAISVLKLGNYRLYAAVPNSSAQKITEITFTEKTAVFIGNEGNGLTEETKQLVENLLTIPMGGRAESLNAATAAAIIMWEMVK